MEIYREIKEIRGKILNMYANKICMLKKDHNI